VLEPAIEAQVGPAPPPVPPFSTMNEAVKRRIVQRLFGLFDLNGDGTVDVAEFATGVCRVIHGAAKDKLALMFDVYDADGDGDVSLLELGQIILGAFNLTTKDASTDRDEYDRRQDDLAFASELANALDINGDGSISR